MDEKLSGGIAPFVQHLYVPYKGKYYDAKLIFEENIFKTKMKCYLNRELSNSSHFYENNDVLYGGYISGSMIKENDFYSHIYADYYEYLKETYKNKNIDYFDLDISYIPADFRLAPNYIRLNCDYVDRIFVKKPEVIKMYIIMQLGGEPFFNEDFEEGFYISGTYYSADDSVLEMSCYIVTENSDNNDIVLM